MKQNFPIARELVLAGGGHSHVILLRMLGMNPVPGLKVTLISPEVETPYSGMLPGLVAGHYERDDCYIDLVPLCRFAGADFVKGSVSSLDPVDQRVSVEGRPDIHYDVLSLDVGCTPSLSGFTGTGVIPVKPISQFLGKWQEFVRGFDEDEINDIAFVGAGAGGVELCLAVQHYIESQHNRPVRLHMVTEGKTVLKEFPASTRIRFENILHDKRISVHRDFRAKTIANGKVHSEDGRELVADRIFCVTQASAQGWLADSLQVDDGGFVKTHDTLQTTSFENIFAVGDCATMINYPRPKAGVFAVRQGAPLAANIRRFLYGETLKPFKPQLRYLALISTGPEHAIASRNGISIAGNWVWQWKNWIDQRFMQKFSDLPEMNSDVSSPLLEEFDDQMHCGGCGSKVSADLLSEVIGDLLGEKAPRDDAAQVLVPEGRVLVQSVDHFRSVIDDPYRQARIAVCHSFSDIYACGGTALSALAMLTLPFGKPDATRSLLRQLMSGAIDQINEDGAALIGGHTSEGLELSIGFTVNGTVSDGGSLSKEGLVPGDNLILTKPLGTGTLLAANMQYKAKGAWVEAAVEMMLQSNRTAAGIFTQYRATACTDITGFGLAGHCSEMLNDSIGIALDASAIPVLQGADECLYGHQISSSLHDANRRSVYLQGEAPEILFDPQTSGGLLAGVAADRADECLQALRRAGYDAAIIGSVDDLGGLRIT